MKIKNISQLATSELRKAALDIAEAGLEAIDTTAVVSRYIKIVNDTLFVRERQFSLDQIDRLFVVGVGKCSFETARALESVLGDRIAGGIVFDVRCDDSLKHIKTCVGTHPFPSEGNVDVTREIIELLRGLTSRDLVLVIISGGGSTLLCQPSNFTCFEEAELVQCLFKAGATIQELNTVRKHLSSARGGWLAQYAYPARVVSMVFSDVPGNNLEYIASGPTVLDTTTIADARRIFEKYHVKESCGLGEEGFIETPKDHKYFQWVEHVLFLSNEDALRAMAEKAANYGYAATIRTTCLEGEARMVGPHIVDALRTRPSKTALLYGGETTVKVFHPGKGGRNLELALSTIPYVQEGELILTLASDGRDNTDFAGALADVETHKKTIRRGLDVEQSLLENDSYHFFEKVGDYIITGHTGSNVSDLIVALKE